MALNNYPARWRQTPRNKNPLVFQAVQQVCVVANLSPGLVRHTRLHFT